jgi:glucosamine--fructose-6-phosphate aminotransferase (isomerizing)
MCGIVGILGRGPVAGRLVEALKLLEYRGYDSAGVATLDAGALARRRTSGKLINLETRLRAEPLGGAAGIGHTRWATHGAPTEANAHPHATDRVAVVHNGIIENFHTLRAEIEGAGREFSSETDTEVIAHLLTMALDRGLEPRAALADTLKRLDGAFAVAVLVAGEDDLLLAARRGSPLAIGHGDGEMFLGSDAIALSPFTRTITYLDDGDWAAISRASFEIFTEDGAHVDRRSTETSAAQDATDKGEHRHFMRKEIFEQPEVLSRTFAHYVDFATGRARIADGTSIDFSNVSRLAMSACGTASYAAQIGRYWFERFARLPVEIDIASEFRYREPPLDVEAGDGLALFVSQSGETADTLAALRYAAACGLRIGAIVNVATSSIAREADMILPTFAGPEIGVASTKAFTCQLAVLFALAVHAGRQRGKLPPDAEQRLLRAAIAAPRYMSEALKLDAEIESLAGDLAQASCVLYLGRGTSYPLALEGALKLKEISYIHAEGYAAGELKHGPIALIDEHVPVIVVAPSDHLFDKSVSNMQEVAARGGRIILLTDRSGAGRVTLPGVRTLVLPDVPPEIAPIVYAIPIQLLAYHAAVARGTDVDQPRNLAKSVTVE